MVSPLDLTTIASVTAYLAPTSPGQQEQNVIQQMITSASIYFLRRTSRGHADVQVPAQSPFVQPVSYSDVYDGNLNNRLFLRDFPIISIQSLIVGNSAIQQSAAWGQFGWVIDSTGRSISLRGGGGSTPPGSPLTVGFANLCQTARGPVFSGGPQSVSVQYTAGYELAVITDELQVIGSSLTVATANPWVLDRGVKFFIGGTPLTQVFSAPTAGQYYINNLKQYMFAAADSGKQILISYSTPGTPPDVIEKITKLVAINYKRRQTLDQKSISLSGQAGTTTSYRDWETSPDIEHVISNYSRISRS